MERLRQDLIDLTFGLFYPDDLAPPLSVAAAGNWGRLAPPLPRQEPLPPRQVWSRPDGKSPAFQPRKCPSYSPCALSDSLTVPYRSSITAPKPHNGSTAEYVARCHVVVSLRSSLLIFAQILYKWGPRCRHSSLEPLDPLRRTPIP